MSGRNQTAYCAPAHAETLRAYGDALRDLHEFDMLFRNDVFRMWGYDVEAVNECREVLRWYAEMWGAAVLSAMTLPSPPMTTVTTSCCGVVQEYVIVSVTPPGAPQ